MRKLLVLLALAVTFVAGCGSDDDPALEGTAGETDHNAADVAFAQGMIPHHQQAIEMSDLALAQAQRGEVKDLARRIKAAQQPEIDQMKGWLSDWGEEADGGHGGGHGGDSMGMMSEEEMGRLKEARGAEFDRLFLEGMIRHHEGAVGMANTELAQGKFADAKDLARKIIDTQRAEIEEMRRLLAG